MNIARGTRGGWTALAALLAVVSVAAFSLILVPRAARKTSGGFAAYYTAARVLRDGEPAGRLYDDRWFRRRVEELVPGASEIYFVNPPTTALIARPIAGFSAPSARLVFVVAGAFALAASLWLLARSLRPPPLPLLTFLAFALACQPVRVNLREGQVYGVLVLLLVLTWLAYRSGRDVAAGALLGLLLVFKTAVPALVLVALAARRWRVIASALATGGLVVGLSLPRLGVESWRAYLAYGARWSRDPAIAVTAHQSNASLARHLLRRDALVSPHPLVDAPLLATALTVALALALAVFLWRLARRDGPGDLSFAAATATSLAVTPVSQGYSYVLALFPLAILLFRPHPDRVRLVGVAVSLGLLGIWFLPYGAAGPLPTLLSYPKLYAAWMLFALAVREGTLAARTAPAAG